MAVELEVLGAAVGGAATGGVAAYYAAKEAINVQLARLDERFSALRKDVDSDHGRLENHLHSHQVQRK